LQLALNDLYARIAGGDIDLKRAAALLHVLREASLNLARRTHPTLADPAAIHPSTARTAQTSNQDLACHPRRGSASDTAQTPPQIEAFTHHPHLGDLAPQAEYHGPPTENPYQPEQSSTSCATKNCHPERSAAKSKDLRSPTIDPSLAPTTDPTQDPAYPFTGLFALTEEEKATAEKRRQTAAAANHPTSAPSQDPADAAPTPHANNPTDAAPPANPDPNASRYPKASALGLPAHPRDQGASAPGACPPSAPNNNLVLPTLQATAYRPSAAR
ncbi:MAG TPA: hypothetical protein VGU46_00370, partial [Acidobacteriaceae bacterium]|nr:hypothetical protein [Acidobacteriaceae bacterium]